MEFGVSLFWEAVRIALQSVWTHKLRAFLTLLGIIIGVASVTLVGASIEGLETYVTQTVSRVLGSNSFLLARITFLQKVSEEELQRMRRRNKEPKMEDIAFLQQRCRDCEEIAAEINGVHNTYYGNEELLNTQISGVTANMASLADLTLVEGRFFTESENERSRFVCIIGQGPRERFFPNSDPIGQVLKVGNQPLVVVGVLEKMGSFLGRSLDNVLYMPINAYYKMFGGRQELRIRGRATSRETFEAAVDQVRVAMRARHHLRPDEDDDFGILTTNEINTTVDEFTHAVAMVVTPITLISLLVGGIVVMNIMLVSVTERTFEIGIRKAVGARRRDIVYQFLVEAFLLAATGGTLGLALAFVGAIAVEKTTPLTMTISVAYVLLALGVSGGIGIVFGIYPALKAARLDPVVALASER